MIFFKGNTENFKFQRSLILYVFVGSESNDDKHTETASLTDLENSDQLPVKEVFEDIVMIVYQILS